MIYTSPVVLEGGKNILTVLHGFHGKINLHRDIFSDNDNDVLTSYFSMSGVCAKTSSKPNTKSS